MEESIIEDKDSIVETTVNDNDDDNIEKVLPPKEVDTAMLEKQDSSPTTITKPDILLHTENWKGSYF